jgi:hypothetical protein
MDGIALRVEKQTAEILTPGFIEEMANTMEPNLALLNDVLNGLKLCLFKNPDLIRLYFLPSEYDKSVAVSTGPKDPSTQKELSGVIVITEKQGGGFSVFVESRFPWSLHF